MILAVLTLTLLGSSLALAAPKEKAAADFTLQGRVVAVNLKERTMAVKENGSGQEYVVVVPAETTFRITFGKDSQRRQPQLENVSVGDRVICTVSPAKGAENVAGHSGSKVVITKS
jgi:hypothetical protein